MTRDLIYRSKVKVIRPLNAVTENHPYPRNGKAYKLHTWYITRTECDDRPARWPPSWKLYVAV